MPQYDIIKHSLRRYHEWIVPPGCTPRTDDEWNTVVGYEYKRWNDVDRRPKPEEPDLIWNPTAQEQQYTWYIDGGSGFAIKKYPCPHNGVHGDTTLKLWTYAPVPLIRGTMSSDLWSLKMREKIEAKNINLGNALAEYRQTANQFGSYAKTLVDVYKVLRGKRKRKRITPCAIPAASLQYSFGLAPLTADLFDSVEQLRLKLSKPIIAKHYVSGKQVRSGTELTGPKSYRWRRKRTQKATFYVEHNPTQANLSPFRAGNPAEWAWELLPFSWLVDYMIPVGDWIGSLDAVLMNGVTRMKGTVVTKDRYHETIRTDQDGHHSHTNGYSKYQSHKRDVYSTIPIPPFPAYEPSPSWHRVRNAVAVLWTLNKRCRGR